MPIDQEYERCPVCGETAVYFATFWALRICPKEHAWHCCAYHGVMVLGDTLPETRLTKLEGSEFVYTCSCTLGTNQVVKV